MNPLNFSEHDAQVHARALRAFRVRKQAKRTLLIAPILAGVLFMTFHTASSTKPTPAQPLAAVPPKDNAPPNHNDFPIAPYLLTDDQLLGMFPAGSCFLAEVNGRKILVFNEP